MSTLPKKDSKFMDFFWNLASDDVNTRLDASTGLLNYLQTSVTSSNEDVSTNADVSYSLQRLVKGLGSSRESARQGYATCLCELLSQPGVEVATVLKLLDQHTKLTGSVKGSEERDFMFGKLFCYICIVRAGYASQSEEVAIEIFARLLDLHERKGWSREVVVEAILLLCESAKMDKCVTSAILPKIANMFSVQVENMAAWQIQLLIGVQNIARDCKHFRKIWQQHKQLKLQGSSTDKEDDEMESEQQIEIDLTFDIGEVDSIKETLLACTAGYPKVHRVWDYLLSFIFPMDSERELIPCRCTSFTPAQESALQTLAVFIDRNYLQIRGNNDGTSITAVDGQGTSNTHNSSMEKRCVGLHVVLEMVQRCPAEYIPVALSKAAVHCIRMARGNKKHTLHGIAGAMLSSIVSSVANNNSCRLAVASSFVQYGGATFDSYTSSDTVETLLSGMDFESIVAYLKFLCGVVAASRTSTHSSIAITEEGANTCEEHDGSLSKTPGRENTNLRNAISALEALAAIAKNARIECRSQVCITVAAVLVRLSCFTGGTGETSLNVRDTGTSSTYSVDNATVVEAKHGTKSNKKKKVQSAKNMVSVIGASTKVPNTFTAAVNEAITQGAALPLPSAALECIHILEASSGKPSPSTNFTTATLKGFINGQNTLAEYPVEVVAVSDQKLLSLLADIGVPSCTMDQLDVVPMVTSASEEKSVAKNSAVSEDVRNSKDKASSPQMMEFVWRIVTHITASGVPLRIDSTAAGANIDATEQTPSSILKLIAEALQRFDSSAVDDESGNKSNLIAKLANSLRLLVMQTSVHALITSEVDIQTAETLSQILSGVLSDCVAPVAVSDNNDDDSDDREDEEEEEGSGDALLQLFEVSLDLLTVTASSIAPAVSTVTTTSGRNSSASSNNITRALRDAVKRVWQCAFSLPGSHSNMQLVDAAVASVVGLEDREATDEDEGTEESIEEEGNSADETSEEKQESFDAAQVVSKLQSKQNKEHNSKTNRANATEDAVEDGDGEDVLISQAEAFTMMAEDSNDGSDDNSVDSGSDASEGGRLNHRSELDSALAHMINMRKQSRKQGMLQAHRQQLLVRSRCMDLVEIIVQKVDSGIVLFPLFFPLLQCLSSVYSSGLTQNVAEGVNFTQRLHSLLEQKLAKRKVVLRVPDDCSADEVATELEPLLSLIAKLLVSPVVALRQTAHVMYVCVARTVCPGAGSNNEGSPAAQALLRSTTRALFCEFTSKKNTRISKEFISDLLVNKLPDVCIPILWKDFIDAILPEKRSYLRTELCLLLSSVLRKYNGLSTDAQNTVRIHYSAMLSALVQMLDGVSNSELKEDSAAVTTITVSTGLNKKLKPIISAIKDAVDALKRVYTGLSTSSTNTGTVVDVNTTIRTVLTKLKSLLGKLTDAKGSNQVNQLSASTDIALANMPTTSNPTRSDEAVATPRSIVKRKVKDINTVNDCSTSTKKKKQTPKKK